MWEPSKPTCFLKRPNNAVLHARALERARRCQTTNLPSARYRRLASECLELAQTFPVGERRSVLLQMAQVWQRLADVYADSSVPLFQQIEGERSAVQQQQQIKIQE